MTTANLASILADGPVIPVIVIEEVAQAVPLAKALVAGGVRVLEVTLRTDAGLIDPPDDRRGTRRHRGCGHRANGGTARRCRQARRGFRRQSGGHAAAPRCRGGLAGVAAARNGDGERGHGGPRTGLHLYEAVPGRGCGRGRVVELAGVAPTRGQVLSDRRYRPEKAKRYLALPNVVCVGGSWLVPRDALRQGDWGRITELARGTGALRRGVGQPLNARP